MRKINGLQIAVFLLLLSLVVVLGVGSTAVVLGGAPLGDFRGVALVAAGVVLTYLWAFAVFRGFLRVFPLEPGEVPPGSRQEFVYHVYLLFFLTVFHPLMRSGVVPVPLMRLVYLALGARLGANTYSSGIIFDPPYVEMGDDCLMGQYALLVPHVIENERLAHYPIRIGSGVTIGAHAVVMAGVTIEDGALVATGAVVPKGARIGRDEVWGGVPARRLTARRQEA